MTSRPDHDSAILNLVRSVDPLASEPVPGVEDDATLRALNERIDALQAGTDPGGAPARPRVRVAGRRSRVAAGASLGLAGVGAALVFVLGGSTAPPAFAITTNSDGSVSVTMDTTHDIAQINQQLAEMGIGEQITLYSASGPGPVSGPISCRSQPGAAAPDPPVTVTISAGSAQNSGNTGSATSAGDGNSGATPPQGDGNSGATPPQGDGNSGAATPRSDSHTVWATPSNAAPGSHAACIVGPQVDTGPYPYEETVTGAS